MVIVAMLSATACGDYRDFEALTPQHVETNRAGFVQGIIETAIQHTPELELGGDTLFAEVNRVVTFDYRLSDEQERSVVVTARGMATVEQTPLELTVVGEVPFLVTFGK